MRSEGLGHDVSDQMLSKHVLIEEGFELRDVAFDVRLRATLFERASGCIREELELDRCRGPRLELC